MERQHTATVYIFEEERVLLLFHKKLKRWLPPGGHIEPNELPHEAACREAREETGVLVEIVSDEHIITDEANAQTLPRPYMMLLEEIPPHKGMAAHQHIDHIFLGHLTGRQEPLEEQTVNWFSLEEINALPEETIYSETRNILCHLFTEQEALCAVSS